jgi:hypothetical protein
MCDVTAVLADRSQRSQIVFSIENEPRGGRKPASVERTMTLGRDAATHESHRPDRREHDRRSWRTSVARMSTSTIIVIASVVTALSAARAQPPSSASAAEPPLAVAVSCNEEAAAVAGVSDPVEPRLLSLDVGQERTSQSGSAIAHTSDVLMKGIAPDRAEDLAYQLAYRECVERQRREP